MTGDTSARARRRALVLAVLAAAAPAAGAAATQLPNADSAFGGLLFRRIAARRDTTQHYALLLPRDYSAERRYPLLLVLDPRSRALVPMELFGPPAMRHGFLVMSSYNSASDGPVEPTVGAVNAMLDDATRALAIDRGRIYLVGFSGTARLAWTLAAELRGIVGGIVELCAGPPNPAVVWTRQRAGDTRFVVFSATGDADFNHDEVLELDRSLLGLGIAHRTVVFEGGHAWGPAPVASEAVEWLALRELVGRHEAADSFVAGYRDRRLADLDSLRAAADTTETIRRFTALARDLPDDPVVAAYGRGPMGPLLEQARSRDKEERRRIERDGEWTRKAGQVLDELATAKTVPTADRLADEIGLEKLLAAAGSAEPRAERMSARRRLEWLFANAAFYGPRSYLETSRWAPILVLLDLAHRIHPLGPDGCRMGREALGALGRGSERRYPECGPARG